MDRHEQQSKLAYSIPEFLRESGIGSRSTVYKEIAEGRLKTVKVGSRRLIPYQAAQDWLKSLQQEAA